MYNFIGHILDIEEPSFLRELFESIKTTYFTPDLGEYNNLNIGFDSAGTIRIIILGLLLGVIIASFMAVFNKRILGDFVRKIISEECFDHENAKTISELGFIKNAAVRGSLKRGVTLKRVVRCVEEENYYKQFGIEPRPVKQLEKLTHGDETETQDTTAEAETTETEIKPELDNQEDKKEYDLNIPSYKIDLNNDHFYIAKNESYMADAKFEAKGTNWLTFGLSVVASIVVAVLIFRFLPEILQILDNFIGAMKPNDNILR